MDCGWDLYANEERFMRKVESGNWLARFYGCDVIRGTNGEMVKGHGQHVSMHLHLSAVSTASQMQIVSFRGQRSTSQSGSLIRPDGLRGRRIGNTRRPTHTKTGDFEYLLQNYLGLWCVSWDADNPPSPLQIPTLAGPPTVTATGQRYSNSPTPIAFYS